MVDRALVHRKLADLETYLDQMREFSGLSLDQYQGDWKMQRIVERTLQIMIETCVDIAGHLIADSNWRSPTSYSESFVILKENVVIDSPLSVSLERMAKFRNVVVHRYDQIDSEIVLVILRDHMIDFERYRDAVLSYLAAPRTL